jgi:trimeric autotransporter adhesin
MKQALHVFAITLVLTAGLVPVQAQTIEREPDTATYSKSQAEDGGFVISNTSGDTLFVAEPNHQIRMGRLPAAEVFVNRDGTGGLQVIRGAADGSGIWGIITNEESGFYAVRGETAGRGAGVLGIGLAGQRGTGVFGVSNGGGAGVRGYGYGDGGMGGVFFSNTSTIEPALVAEYGGSGTGAAFIARRYASDPDANIALFGTGAVGSEGEKYVAGITGGGNIWTTGSIHASGTITSDGADFAERFAVIGGTSFYAPGDVLQISSGADRHLELTAEPYSRRIAGVYATKPGVLLGDLPSEESVPLGVVGVVPTKVTTEGGAIQRGDLLVTSSTPGHAMKGDIDKILVGMVIGRALQDFDGGGSGMIEVLVNVQ